MRHMISLAFGLLALLPMTAAEPKPVDRPIPPSAAAQAMTVPKGFKATLFAGEPDITQPIAMTFDDRGRLWVVECYSYPKWTTDGTGKDRVVILEDIDGDGKFDKRTVFYEKGVNLSGIELGFGGVWLCSSPNLVFIPIKPGEDQPAGPAEIVLDGWNVKEAKHNVFNSLGWGPDGWLYGCNGIQSKSRVGRPGTPDKDRELFDCGVWRYHPTRKIFEPVAWGTTNPWGLDWDDYGQMFITNCVIHHLWHIIPGGHYQRMYGEDPTPNTYGLMTSCADHLHWGGGDWTSSRTTGVGGKPEHSAAGGGHAHSGALVYLGDNFPPEYRNSVFMCNIHGNRINRDTLERTKSGYVGKHAPDFLFANDPWFRGLCLKSGPDGGLYVSDWSDTGECHNYAKVDASSGRIFKVVYGSPKHWTGDISKMTDAELVKLQLHPNDWFVRHARRVLQERAVAGKLGNDVEPGLRTILKDNKEITRRVRAVWALHVTGLLTVKDQIALMQDADEQIQAWAVRLSMETRNPPEEITKALAELSVSTISRQVSYALLGEIPRLPVAAQSNPKFYWGLVNNYTYSLKHAKVSSDHNYELMMWYAARGIYDRKKQDPVTVLCRFGHGFSDGPAGVLRKVVRQVVSERSDEENKEAIQHFLNIIDEDNARPILEGIIEALEGRKRFPEPLSWNDTYSGLQESKDPSVLDAADRLAVIFGNAKILAALKARILDPKADSARRIAAINLLTRKGDKALVPVLQEALTDTVVRGPAVRALAAFSDDSIPETILKHYPTFTPVEKADAVQTLASRASSALRLLTAVEAGKIPRTDISISTARQLLAVNHRDVSAQLEKAWGKVQPPSKDRAGLIKKWKETLTPDSLKTADRSAGRLLYTKQCATCHKLFGEGTEIGPDLTGSQRANLDYLLENVLDPSAVVPNGYRVTTVTLVDGRVVSGIILRETADTVTVRTVNDTLPIAKADIESRKPSSQSLMPDGLFDQLSVTDVRNLVAYLASPVQVK